MDQNHWVAPRLQEVPLAGTQVLLRDIDADRPPQVATRELSAALRECRDARTLDEHAAAVAAAPVGRALAQAGVGPEQIREQLRACTGLGLLVPVAEVLGRAAPSRDAPVGVQALAIRTCERPEDVARLLGSLEGVGGDTPIRVFDDSRSTAGATATRERVAAAAPALGARLAYSARAEEDAWFERLAAAFPEHRPALELLLRDTPGQPMFAGRVTNVILLRHAGAGFVLCDDDAEAVVRRPLTGVGEGLAFDNGPRRSRFPDVAGDLPPGQCLDLDPLQAHAHWLGRGLGSVVDADSLAAADTGTLGPLGAGSRVILTLNGTLGDPGTANNHWLYTLTGAARDAFAASPAYAKNRYRRLMEAAHPRPTLSNNGWCMTTTFSGIDATRLMPPWTPFYRASDGVFGAMCRFLYPHDYTLHLPWTLDHFPRPLRDYPDDSLARPRPRYLSHLLEGLALQEAERCLAAAPEQRLRWFGEQLCALAEAPADTLAKTLREALTRSHAQVLSALNGALADPPAGADAWAADVQGLIRVYHQALTEPPGDEALFAAMAQVDADPEVAARRFLGGFGEGCRIWPEVWAWAVADNAAHPVAGGDR